ncbi:MAG: hypothetical protein ACLS7B_09490 [Hominilimicola sp.]
MVAYGADVVTYGVIGAKGVPYEVNGKVGVLLNVECEEEKDVEGAVPYENITQKRGDQRSPHIAEKIILRLLR